MSAWLCANVHQSRAVLLNRACEALALKRWQHTHADDVKNAFQSCQTTVQQHDHENFLWAKTLPANVRPPIMMLRALNVETSMIGDMVSQGGAPLREMRFAWWRDSINNVYAGNPVKHPVLEALRYTLDVTALPKYRLQRIVSAKEQDQVAHQPPQTLEDLEQLAEATQSNLLYLQLEAAGIKNADADHAASHLGKAVGIASLLRGTLPLLQRGISYMPVQLCAQHGVSTEELYRGINLDSAGMREVVYEVASAANGHLQACQELHGRPEAVPREARQLFMSSVACKLFLEALQKCNFNLTDKRMQGGGFTPLWHILSLKYVQARV